ncbi:MAG: endonuclease III, partial [Planctomycetes bacterium]|nr:endonuclease III [Planctomycetota bacterium]
MADVYGDLVDAAPTPRDLLANRERVRSLLSHLGLNWRTDNVVDLAEALRDDYSNSVPGTWGDLVSLPGIGKYVASAVLCFSFGQPAVLVDTNTSRIARRLTGQKNLSPWEI